MNQAVYLAIAIAIIVALVATFVLTYVINRRTPAPEGAEVHHPSAEKCGPCAELGCPFYERFHKEEN